MNKAIFSIIIFFFFFIIKTEAQCPAGGAIFVNEIYNGQGNKEYIELVVLGDPANPTDPVNLEGWIVDDNNIDQAGQGTAAGHLILNSTFNNVNPGAIILIYNENDPPAGIPTNNPPWLYVVTGTDLDGCSASPSTSNSNYAPCGTPGGHYQYVGMRQDGDIVQTRNSSVSFYHAVRYGNVNVMSDVVPADVSDKSIGLNCGDWFDGLNYTITDQSPGIPNSDENENLINAIKNGTLDCNDIDASCLFPCPIISGIDIVPNPVCDYEDFTLTATGLANMSQSLNGDKDFGIDFVYFIGGSAPSDPYSGGTSLGTVPFSDLLGTDPNQTAEKTITGGTLSSGTYTICAILDDVSANDCKPSQCDVIQISQSPEASLSGTQVFCPGECYEINTVIAGGAEPYDASFELIIGSITLPFNIPAYDVNNQLTICYNGNVFPYYDNNTLYVPLYITGTGSLVLTSLVDNNGCEAQNIDPNHMTLIFKDKLDINAAGPLEECDYDFDGQATFDLTVLDIDLTGGASGQTANWYEDSDCTTSIINPSSFTTSTTTVYVFLSDDSGDKCDSDTIPIDLNVIIIPDPGDDDFDEICNTENCYSLFYNLGGSPDSGGNWTDDDGSGVDLSDPICVDFTSVSTGTYNFTYTIQDSGGKCDPQSATLTIDVSEPGNPGDDGEDTFCGAPQNPIDLESYLGGYYDNNGTWFNSYGIDVTNPNNVDISSLSTGDYVFQYSVENTPCPEQEAIVTIHIIDSPNAGNDNILYVCNAGTNTIQDLESALGWHDTNGDWFSIDTIGVDLSNPDYFDFEGWAQDTFRFRYIIPDNGTCPSDTAEITVIVESIPNAGIGGNQSLCVGSTDTMDLYDFLGMDFDSTGVWMQIGGDPVDISKPDTVIFSTAPVGIDSFIYVVTDTCGNDTAKVYISITASPYAGDDYNYLICENSIINLFDSLGNYNIGGIWYDLANDTVFNPENVLLDSAGNFSFLYVLPENGTCAGDTAVGNITVLKAPEAGVGDNFSVCQNSSGIINLFDHLTDYSQSDGTWQDHDGNKILNPSNYNFAAYDTGQFVIKYILPGNGYCDGDTAELSVFVVAEPNAGTDNNFTVCNSDINNIVDLDNLLGNHDPVGKWYNIDNVNISLNHTSQVDFSGVKAGIYRFEYKIDANETCPADSALVTIEVKEKISAGIDKDLTFCEDGNTTINIVNELNPDQPADYKFEDLNQTGAINGTSGEIDISLLSLGQFEFGLITGINDLCGSDTAILTITIVQALKAGNDNQLEICNDETNINLDDLLGVHDAGGKWIDLDNSGVDVQSTAGKNVTFDGVNKGIYRYKYLIESSGTCPESSAIITVTVNPVTTFDFVKEICPGQDFTIGDNIYNLSNPTGTEFLINVYGCDSIVNINLTEKETSSEYYTEDENCFGKGKFVLQSLSGTEMPVTLNIDSVGTYTVNTVPYTVDNLDAGTYQFSIIDNAGCSAGNGTFSISGFEPYTIEIEVIQNEDNYTLNVISNINAATIEWQPHSGLSCYDCLTSVAKPSEDTQYIVTLTDREGCTVSDTIDLKAIIKEIIDIDIPNIFTPDGDGYNDIFYAKSSKEGLTYDMYIFDRWGEKIFFAKQLDFNDSAGAWDGYYRGKKALPGVYVYMIIVNYDNGQKETLAGDLLLIR